MQYLSLIIPGVSDPIEPPAGLPSGGFTDSATGNSILNWGLEVAFFFAVVVVLFMIVFGGVQWILSGGDKEKLSNARKRIIYSILGLVVIFLSVVLINLLLEFFGIEGFAGDTCIQDLLDQGIGMADARLVCGQ